MKSKITTSVDLNINLKVCTLPVRNKNLDNKYYYKTLYAYIFYSPMFPPSQARLHFEMQDLIKVK